MTTRANAREAKEASLTERKALARTERANDGEARDERARILEENKLAAARRYHQKYATEKEAQPWQNHPLLKIFE